MVRDDFCIKNRHKRYIACDDEARGQTVWGADAAGTKCVIKKYITKCTTKYITKVWQIALQYK